MALIYAAIPNPNLTLFHHILTLRLLKVRAKFPIAYVTMTTTLYLALGEPPACPSQMISPCHCNVQLCLSLGTFSHFSEHTPLVLPLFPLGLLARLRMGFPLSVAIQIHLDWILDAFGFVLFLFLANAMVSTC